MSILEALELKPFGIFNPALQVILILVLLIIAVATQYREYKKTGKTYGRYPMRISLFLSSIYEEMIFRGLILFGLLMVTTPIISVIISSLLFGLWHFKNYKWQTFKQTLGQVLYAGLIFGPIAAIITILAGTIWPAVIVHYSANILSDAYRKKRL